MKLRFVREQKYVDLKGPVCAHGNADYLLENLIREYHENVVNQKLKHLDDVFFNVLSFRISRAARLSCTIKLLGQGYVRERLKSSLRKFYGRYGDQHYEVPLS